MRKRPIMDANRKRKVASFLVLFIQLIFVSLITCMCMKKMVDYDSSVAFFHAIQMSKQKTIFLKDFVYQTSADLDSASIFVAFVYAILGNIFVSQSLVDIVLFLFMVYVVYKIFEALDTNVVLRMLGCALVFIPYTFGQLGYATMFFTGTMMYYMRIVVPLLLLCIVLRSRKGNNNFLLLICVLETFSFLIGLSSGIYVIACGIFPIMLGVFIYNYIENGFRILLSKELKICILTIIFGMFGVIGAHLVGFPNRTSSMNLISAPNWLQNIGAYFVGIFELYNGVAEQDGISVFSFSGIEILINFVFTCLLIVTIVYQIYEMLRKRKVDIFQVCSISIWSVNCIALTLLNVTYGSPVFEFRYHILPMIPIMILFVQKFQAFIEKQKINENILLMACIVATGILAGVNDYHFWKSFKEANIENYESMAKQFAYNNISTAVFFGSEYGIDGRVMRVFSDNVDCIAVGDEWNDVNQTLWGGSKYALENSKQRGPIAIITSQDRVNEIPPYMFDKIDLLQKFENYNIYLAFNSKADWVAGYDENSDFSIDYPYTPGYVLQNGDILEDGEFITNGKEGFVLSGPYSKGATGKWKVILQYKIVSNPSGGEATFDVSADYGKRELGKVELSENRSTVTLDVELTDQDMSLENRVWIPEGMIIELASIRMEKE